MTHRSSLLVAVLVPALFATIGVDGAAAQADADSLAAQVDQLFAQWDKPDSPGCTCAVMRDGEVVYSRAFGMANLEHDVPLTPQSAFNVGSVSKQFTAASIALLALRGQLSLDDDIRMYVPEMPDFDDTITIRHLVHHTSGIRGFDLRRFSRSSGSSNVRLLAALSRQRTPDFRPGEEYGYRGFGYVVLAEIVKRVSGQSLREFAEENIFGPLGMANTHFDDNSSRIVKHRVQGYAPRQGGYRRYVRDSDMVGSSGLLTTAEDLLRWNRNFDDMTVGGPDFIELITTRGTLNNGDTLEYAFGLRLREYRGLKIVRLGGLVGGFLARLVRFPEEGFAVAVLCNSTAIAIGSLPRGVADIYLRGEFGAAATADASPPAPKAVTVSTSELQEVAGYYWDDTIKLLHRIYVQEDTLRYSRDDRKLVPLGNDRFYRLGAPTERMVSFTSPTPEQPRQMIDVIADGEPRVYDAVEPVSPSPMELEGYLGTYYSEDADYEWVLRITNDRLSMWDPRTWDELVFRPVVRDVFQLGEYTFTFSRDGQDRVVGFAVDTERLQNLKFVRR